MSAISYWDGTKWVSLNGAQGQKGDKGDPGQDGQPGADGKGFNPTGDFEASTTYALGDVVQYGGSSYVLVDVPPAGTKPDDAGAGAYWNLLASKGADGASGSAGEKGDKGDTGDTGADGRSVNVTVSPTAPAGAVAGDFWLEP